MMIFRCLAVAWLAAAWRPAPAAAGTEASGFPPVSAYRRDLVRSVTGGLVYGLTVHPETHAVYIASETMTGGFWGLAHGPANGTWMSADGVNWRRIGPGGRNVKVSRSDPNVIYANDADGLHKTVDGGENWTTILSPEYRIGYRGLDICASDHDVVYAGGPGRLHVSRDGGVSWRHHAVPGRIQVIQAHPDNPDSAVLAFYGEGRGGVWKTIDAGATVFQLTEIQARAMAVCEGNPEVIYCSRGVTFDGGATWRAIGPPMPAAWCITVHPRKPEVAYYSRPGRAVYVTIDGGATFWPIQGVLHNYDGTEAEGMAIDAARDVLWVGGDRIWRGEGASTGRIRLVAVDDGWHDISFSHIASAPSGVWAASDAQGVHYTTDGRRWITTAMGMHGTEALHRITPSRADPNTIYAGHERRTFKSEDGGRTWFQIFRARYPYCLTDALDADVLYMSTDRGTDEMVRSDDGGMTYNNLGMGRFLAVHPHAGGIVWIERRESADAGFHVSEDYGASFTRISERTGFGEFLVSPSDPRLFYDARFPRGRGPASLADSGLYRSDDSGRTWTKKLAALPAMARIAEIGDGSLWLASPPIGLARSVDRGRTWETVWDAFGDMTADPWQPNSLYMIARGAIWRLYPEGAEREHTAPAPPDPDPPPQTVTVTGPFLADRSNTTYVFDGDVVLKGERQSLILLERGLKNIVFDGRGHAFTLTTTYAIFGDDAENVVIRNFRFVSGGDMNPGTVISLSHSRNVIIENCVFETPGALGIETDGIFSDNITIVNCALSSGRSGAVNGMGRHTIRECRAEPSRSGPLVRLMMAGGSVFENNSFDETAIEIRVPGRPPAPAN